MDIGLLARTSNDEILIYTAIFKKSHVVRNHDEGAAKLGRKCFQEFNVCKIEIVGWLIGAPIVPA